MEGLYLIATIILGLVWVFYNLFEFIDEPKPKHVCKMRVDIESIDDAIFFEIRKCVECGKIEHLNPPKQLVHHLPHNYLEIVK